MIEVRSDLTFLSGYHSPQVDVEVRLNTNESPLPPPQAFVDEVASRLHDIKWNRYPDRTATALRSAIAGRHDRDPSEVFLANGSNEVLQTVALTYAGTGRTVACFEPGYQMHAQISRVSGATVATLDRTADFTLDSGAVREFLASTDPSVVFLTSPNNPTGLSEPIEMVDLILESCGALLVVDEAYAEFGRWSAIDLIADDRPLVVSRTFSKTWSMAAARLGYLIGPRAVVANLWNTVLPYHLDSVTQLAGLTALNHVDEMDRRVASIVSERERISTQLDALGARVVPSDANFVLFSPPGGDATTTWSALVSRGVLVRDCSTWPGLDGWLRVTVGTPSENDRFLEALKESSNG